MLWLAFLPGIGRYELKLYKLHLIIETIIRIIFDDVYENSNIL